MKNKTMQIVTLTPLLKGSDMYHVFYVSEFEKKFNLKKGKIRKILLDLEKQKILIKIKSYPVFWKRIKE